MNDPRTQTVEALRLEGLRPRQATDEVVVEEPLEIRIDGDALAVTMRTPGHDRELVLGFLLAEGIIATRGDVLTVTHCGRIGDPRRANTVDVKLVPGVKPPIDPETGAFVSRGTLTTSACGVCGRRSVDDLVARVAPLQTSASMRSELIADAVGRLRERQPTFARTGGCHAAALVDLEGEVIAAYEDVGRHNAVDKVVGSRLLAGELPCSERALIVSGRASFEIVQKALAAGIPIVAAVSAPSSLAVALAARAGLTLIGFVRDGAMSVYSHTERVRCGSERAEITPLTE